MATNAWMSAEPQAAPYRPETPILSVVDWLADEVARAAFPQAAQRFRNERRDRAVGRANLSDEQWVRHFARFQPLGGNLPRLLTLRYLGHQFREYNPKIGAGRGFLVAQLRDAADEVGGRLLDLGTTERDDRQPLHAKGGAVRPMGELLGEAPVPVGRSAQAG